MKTNIIVALLTSSVVTFLAMNQDGARGFPILVIGFLLMMIHIVMIIVKHVISSYRGNSCFIIGSVLKEMGIIFVIYLLTIILGVYIGNQWG